MIFTPKIKDTERVFEKVLTNVFHDSQEGSLVIARYIIDAIKAKQKNNESIVLGLATGNSPKKVYEYLIRIHKEEEVSFENVYTVNLDEYYGLKPDNPNSFHSFMQTFLFDYVNIPIENILIPKGDLDENEIASYCESFEKEIDRLGGIDIQLLGIGQNGHVGFNEPGSNLSSLTRLVPLEKSTRLANSSQFFGLENTPKKAITMGLNTILKAKEIILLGWGETKAKIIKKMVEGDVSVKVPASSLQNHRKCVVVIDQEASGELTRKKTPWKVASVQWDLFMKKKAVILLASKLKKGILMLSEEDYINEGLGDLVAEYETVYELNQEVFYTISDTIIQNKLFKTKQKVLLFSPHPDDDIISMGATFRKLQEEGHEVHVAYQTSGNIAVSNEYASELLDFTHHLLNDFDEEDNHVLGLQDLLKVKYSSIDPIEVRKLKTLVRESEARATCKFVGIPESQIHFLKLPFYETGKVQKSPLSDEDTGVIAKLLLKVRPTLIFAAGDLADPHGTHKTCLDAVFKGLDVLREESFLDETKLLLYRGAWAEWEVEESDIVVPMSSADVFKKRHGIFKHQSQKDIVMYQGNDDREFWQRAEDRNRQTAEKYRALGFPAYTAMESFKVFDFKNESI